jgi:hypothetical protein
MQLHAGGAPTSLGAMAVVERGGAAAAASWSPWRWRKDFGGEQERRRRTTDLGEVRWSEEKIRVDVQCIFHGRRWLWFLRSPSVGE